MSAQTPKFQKPPVIETVLGVQFEPLDAMRVVHFGLFWEQIKDEFPEVEERKALEPQFERFEEPTLTSGVRWKVSQRPDLPRAWFIGAPSDSGQQLIQVQIDRFLYNWRRESLENELYPSYGNNRDQFEEYFRRFTEFVNEQKLASVLPNQCEVTYVNQILIPDGRTFGEMLPECFPIFAGKPSDEFLPAQPERARFLFSYRIDDNHGRLHIDCKPGTISKTNESIIDLRLTARCTPSSPDVEGVMSSLDLGHLWVVNGFKSFTSEKMHSSKVWGLEASCQKS